MKFDPIFSFCNGHFLNKEGQPVTCAGKVFDREDIPHLLSLDEAQAEKLFSVLKTDNVSFIQWPVTWEAIEPEPETYDEMYLANLRTVLKKAEDFDIYVFIQSVCINWSKALGGLGAPLWTLDAAKITPQDTAESQEKAKNTMFAYFWSGNQIAPDFLIEGDTLQDYLQNRYIEAMKHTARRIKDCVSVLGFNFISQYETGSHPLLTTNTTNFAEECFNPFITKFQEAFQKKHGHYLYLADLIPLHAHKNLATTVQLLWEDEDANDTKKVALLSLSQLGLSSDPDAIKNLPLLQELQQKGVPIFWELPKDFTLNPAETEKLSGLSYFSIASRVSTLLT